MRIRPIQKKPPRKRGTMASAALASLGALLLAACPSLARSTGIPWSGARQLVLVTIPDWDSSHGTLRTFAGNEDGWTPVGDAVPVVIGRAGAAWGMGLHPPQLDGDARYEIGFVIEHNPAREPAAGSCIFALSGSPPMLRLPAARR